MSEPLNLDPENLLSVVDNRDLDGKELLEFCASSDAVLH